MAWLLAAAPSSAGGWWGYVHIEGQYVGVGETLVATSAAFFPTVEQAEQAQTKQYYAYLVRGYDKGLLRRAMTQPDPKRWWALSAEAELVQVGRVRLGGWDANLGEARARIEIPKIATGRWGLMFCDAGCREPMANIIPTSVRVTADAVTAKMADRVAALEERAGVVPNLRAAVRDARSEAADAGAEAASARQALADVTRRVQALEAAARQPPSPSPWPWSVAAALVLVMVGIVVASRRRSGSADPAGTPPDDAMPLGPEWETLRPLAETGRSRRRSSPVR